MPRARSSWRTRSIRRTAAAYWKQASYAERFEAGELAASFDKDFIRAWVAARCDPYKDPIPAIPEELILGTSAVYAEAYARRSPGWSSAPDLADATVFDRIVERLTPFFPG